MVNKLTPEGSAAISAAITAAERRTSAEIAVVIAPASDTYQPYLLLYGFGAGSMTGMLLWWTGTITAFPALLAIQAASLALFAFLPPVRNLIVPLLPRRLLHHHAARRSQEEFLFISRQVPPGRPVVLLYVALAERYAHILHSRAIPAKIPHTVWDAIIAEFTGLMKTAGLQQACVTAIGKTADALVPHFPDAGEPNALSDSVR